LKFRTTRKAITAGYYYTIECGYADLQHLLNYRNPVAYTCGTDGWNADIYEVGSNACIVTGYRPFGRIKANYERNREYDRKAEAIVHDYKRPYEERKAELDRLLNELVGLYIADTYTD